MYTLSELTTLIFRACLEQLDMHAKLGLRNVHYFCQYTTVKIVCVPIFFYAIRTINSTDNVKEVYEKPICPT